MCTDTHNTHTHTPANILAHMHVPMHTRTQGNKQKAPENASWLAEGCSAVPQPPFRADFHAAAWFWTALFLTGDQAPSCAEYSKQTALAPDFSYVHPARAAAGSAGSPLPCPPENVPRTAPRKPLGFSPCLIKSQSLRFGSRTRHGLRSPRATRAAPRLACALRGQRVRTWACSWLGTALRPVAAMYVLPMVLIFSTPLNFGLDSSCKAMTTFRLFSRVLTQGQELSKDALHVQFTVTGTRDVSITGHSFFDLGCCWGRALHAFHKERVLGRKFGIMIYFQMT